MKIKHPKFNTAIDDQELLKQLAPNYAFMHCDETNSIKEFYKGNRFSKSRRHRSSDHINYSCYKVSSTINYSLFFESNERK